MTNVQTFGETAQPFIEKRSVVMSMRRGFSSRCPSCGTGAMFSSFAKPVLQCRHCGEDLSHQRADDFPAYLNIFVVGHLVVPGFVVLDRMVTLPMWAHMAIWIPLTIVLAIALMQPIKGAVIGLQWALRMHGFGGNSDEPELDDHPANG